MRNVRFRDKKIIDNARDILVGKLPAPNTQVEQITLAMLYKFMDDIDQESIEMGGVAELLLWCIRTI